MLPEPEPLCAPSAPANTTLNAAGTPIQRLRRPQLLHHAFVDNQQIAEIRYDRPR
jgi:hypothetical protein